MARVSPALQSADSGFAIVGNDDRPKRGASDSRHTTRQSLVVARVSGVGASSHLRSSLRQLLGNSALWACLLIFAATLIFWKMRILDPGFEKINVQYAIDLYIEHIPMAQYAYEEVARGNLPLWNPYQLCGQPFLAIPHVALFYPLHLFSLSVDAIASVDVSFVLHMCLGGICMWLLARRLGFTKLAALGSAVTFMWSAWMIINNVWPGIFAGLNWLPLTILVIDRALDRARYSHAVLIATVTSQILLGASEVLLHTMYVGAAYTTCRLIGMARRESVSAAVTRGVAILSCVATAPLISAPQLLPSLEVVAASGRGEGMAFAEAVRGLVGPLEFLRNTIGTTGVVAVGVLPLLGLPLALGARRHSMIRTFALLMALVAVLLVTWEPAYRFYYSLPVVGSLFRRPVKFLDIYAFSQALVAGFALSQLQLMATWPRARLWRSPSWIACIAVVVASLVWVVLASTMSPWYWFGCLVLLLIFGGHSASQWRYLSLVGLVVVQAASLFFESHGAHVRPIKRPEAYHRYDAQIDSLREQAGADRVYLTSRSAFRTFLTPKQGVLSRVRVSTDYEPLVSARAARFFTAVNPKHEEKAESPFAGVYSVDADSNWTLIDLTASRIFVMKIGEKGSAYMLGQPSKFNLVSSFGRYQAFERQVSLPRAFVVPSARVLSSGDEVLAALQQSDFDPRRQVLLEEPPERQVRAALSLGDTQVDFIVDEPERVVIDVSTETPGFLVLSDQFNPGWRAFLGDREVDIYRANYLFRAVELEPGRSMVRFVYEPASFRNGLLVCGLTLAALAMGALWRWKCRDPITDRG